MILEHKTAPSMILLIQKAGGKNESISLPTITLPTNTWI
ncbi:hypothetical protein LEP1GSC137_2114 [Leptospira borgpetersenii str. Noumea 25]|uniref:Uncharacterized protein n=1 Tax=Leptospira borgpetersenii serovar Ballum TaxID=280505 RepID=A0A0S2IMJ5_LEPBO|nr:hypothetical protein LBBP_00549 [Leptospira borgpetersenii serovar Ballum]EMN59047.1 hypothetical protein LEP1GSC090_2934 [Leptospira borgpetersenii serovar Javanica str. MK146]EMO09807.1 hypothetical protein LEP1GSC137_2114 [Leptospira borgpetersenii str. Noumea 25]